MNFLLGKVTQLKLYCYQMTFVFESFKISLKIFIVIQSLNLITMSRNKSLTISLIALARNSLCFHGTKNDKHISYCFKELINKSIKRFELFDCHFKLSVKSKKLKDENKIHSKF